MNSAAGEVQHLNDVQPTNNVQRQSNDAHQYDSFQNSFEEIELAKLRSIFNHHKNDATFVRLVLKYLYKDNIGILSKRSVKGTKQRKKRSKVTGAELEFDATEPLSPVKMKILSGLFAERLSYGKETEKLFREKNFNQLAAKAICHLRAEQ